MELGVQLAASVTFFTITAIMYGSLCLQDTLPGEPDGKSNRTLPQLVSATGDCGAGAAWKGRHTDKPSFLKPVEKEDRPELVKLPNH